MICDIPKLQTDFKSILCLRTELQTKRDALHESIEKIKTQYNGLVKHNSKKIYLYCLDSMYFQYKILRIELEQFQKMIALIFNRMYGDYYKLYNIIQSQCKDYNINIAISSDYITAYKDLDPFTEFTVENLIVIHQYIIEILEKLQSLSVSKQEEIKNHTLTMQVGFSVTSFISTLSYENNILCEQITLYYDYLSFYHLSQQTYIEKVLTKIMNFIHEIEDEILTNHKTDENHTTKTEDIVSVIYELEPTKLLITIDKQECIIETIHEDIPFLDVKKNETNSIEKICNGK